MRKERPLIFFSSLFVLLALGSVLLGAPVVADYIQTGLVPRLPTAFLATSLMILAFLSLASGLILDTVTRGRWELKRLAYLAIPARKTTPNHEHGGFAQDFGRAFLRFALVGTAGFSSMPRCCSSHCMCYISIL